MGKLIPFIKWAGGKTQLLEQISTRMPKDYNRYFEPFLGGGAVLLSLQPFSAVVNDCNPLLVNTYIQIRDNAEEVIQAINALDSVLCNKNYFLINRNRLNEKITQNVLDVETASLFIWINKHCFNGLYRVNSKGMFNVPYNNKVTGKSIDEKNIRAIGEYLKNVRITCDDFEQACSSVSSGDFVYFDSPYVPISETANFVAYTKDGFSLADHQRLAELFRYLDHLGAKVMLSNNNTELIHELYADYNIEIIGVRRAINSIGNKRTSEEVLITNY